MPIPLAVMIPFMAGQSFAMGEAFGKGFQYGKRRISAMTNEQFNAMSAKDHFEETTADISAMIPSMKSQMNNFSTLQTDIIKTLIEQLKDAGITIGEAVGDVITDTFTAGPAGGTELAQQSLDSLKSLVGLPPTYSKLVAPAGIAALFKFWGDANLLNALKIAVNPSTWIFNEIKKIFLSNPDQNTVIAVQDAAASFVGPLVPEGGILQPIPDPGDNTLVVDPNTGEVVDSGDTRDTEFDNLPPAPSSIRTQWNKYVQELIALDSLILSYGNLVRNAELTQNAKDRIQVVKQLMRDLKFSYLFLPPGNIFMTFSTMI